MISVSAILAGCGDCGLSDAALVRKAVEFYLSERQPGRDGYYQSNGNRYQRYDTFEEFVAINPDCCRLEPLLPEYGAVPLSHRLWYGFRGVVYISSLRKRFDGGSIVLEDAYLNRSFKYDLVVPVSRCGNPLMFLVEE
jgi:hypothetical protein